MIPDGSTIGSKTLPMDGGLSARAVVTPVATGSAWPGLERSNAWPGLERSNVWPGLERSNVWPGLERSEAPVATIPRARVHVRRRLTAG
jgi:hypothetical protein